MEYDEDHGECAEAHGECAEAHGECDVAPPVPWTWEQREYEDSPESSWLG